MKKQTVLLIGGGHAHALVLQAWQSKPLTDNVQILVIDPQSRAPYTGMLPGYVAGHYQTDELYVDIETLTKRVGGEFVAEKVTHIDPDQQIVRTANKTYSYDMLSVDIGIHASLPELPGFQEYAVGVKPLGAFATAWQQLCDDVVSVEKQDIVVLGGGVGGVEVALAMRHRLTQLQAHNTTVTILERGRILEKVSPPTRRFLRWELKQNNVTVREEVNVTKILSDVVVLETETLPATFVLGATGARPYQWVADTSLLTTKGFIRIDNTLRSPQYQNVFAVGDCAHFVSQPLVKAGVYAVRQAPVLQHNIRALLSGLSLKPFLPQKDYLKLISLGDKRAAADKWGICLRGRMLWQLKNYIDQSFMSTLQTKTLNTQE